MRTFPYALRTQTVLAFLVAGVVLLIGIFFFTVVLGKIETIPTPTLVLAADADLLAPPALMRIWASHIKTHEWAVVTDAGHAVTWEQPDKFNAKVLEFVQRH